MKLDLSPPQASRWLPLPLPFTPTTWRPTGHWDGAMHHGMARQAQLAAEPPCPCSRLSGNQRSISSCAGAQLDWALGLLSWAAVCVKHKPRSKAVRPHARKQDRELAFHGYAEDTICTP